MNRLSLTEFLGPQCTLRGGLDRLPRREREVRSST